MAKSKVCRNCNKRKPVSKFYTVVANSDGKCSFCIQCNLLEAKKWRHENRTRWNELVENYRLQLKERRKTDKQVMAKWMYRLIQQRCNNRPSYEGKMGISRRSYIDLVMKSPQFDHIYKQWQASNYQQKYLPTTDRIDVLGKYTKKNIQFLTLSEN